MKKILITVVGLAIGLSFFSCEKQKKTVYNVDSSEVPLSLKITDSSDISEDAEIRMRNLTNKKIYILFGYNYNDESFVNKAVERLSKAFGLYEDGGCIIPVVFPDGFRHKEKAVTVDLFNILDDNDVAGFISLGAPEKTYRALTKIQDQWNGEIPFPVIAMFPQDEILGIEDTSTLVINQLQHAESEENMITESEDRTVSDADIVLEKTVSYILKLDGTPDKDAALATHIRQMIPGRKIHRYTDSDTGLYSINHFIIE